MSRLSAIHATVPVALVSAMLGAASADVSPPAPPSQGSTGTVALRGQALLGPFARLEDFCASRAAESRCRAYNPYNAYSCSPSAVRSVPPIDAYQDIRLFAERCTRPGGEHGAFYHLGVRLGGAWFVAVDVTDLPVEGARARDSQSLSLRQLVPGGAPEIWVDRRAEDEESGGHAVSRAVRESLTLVGIGASGRVSSIEIPIERFDWSSSGLGSELDGPRTRMSKAQLAFFLSESGLVLEERTEGALQELFGKTAPPAAGRPLRARVRLHFP